MTRTIRMICLATTAAWPLAALAQTPPPATATPPVIPGAPAPTPGASPAPPEVIAPPAAAGSTHNKTRRA